MSADPALVAALSQSSPWMFIAFKFELPSRTVRLLDGAGIVTVGSETYTGRDDVFGVLAALDSISEDGSGEAPELKFVLHPPSASSAVTLSNPAMQGSLVSILQGAVNPATMVAIGAPEVLFLGEVDVPTLRLGEKSRQVEFSAVSVFERLFEIDEGERATDGFHQSIWPGELGLSRMTGTEQKLYWGTKPPAGATGGVSEGVQRAIDYVRSMGGNA
jgi:hypothetical protein